MKLVMNLLMTLPNSIRIFTLAVTLLAGLAGSAVHAAFDPVNDDTDIFLANPNIDTQRPNVLLFIDNTANWSRNVDGQAIFINERNALVNVIDNLGDEFNLGTLLYVETGAPNDSVDGANVRYGIRRMTDGNKSILSNIYASFSENGDKGNNATPALGMLEAYRYFFGGNSRASHGKIKSDYVANATHETVTPVDLGEHPLPANPTSSSSYTSPIVNECQKNFVIYISNGPANENASALAISETELASLGFDTSTPIGLSPNGQQGNWADEWAKYMANTDMNGPADGEPHVYTYVVEVDPGTAGQGPAMTALLKSMAAQGKGEYFGVSSENSGASIVDALNKIFNEVQAVNSVFASTTLPVSVNVRGTNLNQVYVGVFRPDVAKSPRWFGNLKMYNLAFDSTTNNLFLADALANEAENPATGFINTNSPSFWTVDEATDFWGFRTAEENGAGGASDYPDGDLVEKGGAAQQQRMAYANGQTLRDLYTCTGTCLTATSPASLTNFDSLNTDITNASLSLGTIAVSSLSAAIKQTVTALSDTMPITINSFIGNITYTLDNGAAGNAQAISSLTTSLSQAITAIDNSANLPIDSLTHPTSGPSADRRTVTAVINAGHGFATGESITISGAANTGFNGTFTINVLDPLTFTYNGGTSVQNEPGSAGGSPVATGISTTVTATVPGHGYSGGESVAVADIVPVEYNGNYVITLDADDPANKFTFTTPAGMPAITDISSATVTSQSTIATATLPGHGFLDGSYVDIAGAVTSGYNGTYRITLDPLDPANKFQYNVGTSLPNATTPGTAAQGNLTVTATGSSAHGFVPGQTVVISGGVPSGYNGTHTVLTTPDGTTFTYNTATPQPANSGSPVYVTPFIGFNTIFGNVGSYPHAFSTPGSAGITTARLIIAGATGAEAVAINTGPGGVDVDVYNFGGWFSYPTIDGSTISLIPVGSVTAKLFSDTAIATLPNHGYGDSGPDALWGTADDIDNTIILTISGADDTRYNATDVTATIIDANTFKYPLATSATLGPDTSTSIKAGIKTGTATARVVAHGFSDGDQVAIAGADQAAFNGTHTITVIDANTFTYPVTPDQGDATGSISASLVSGVIGSDARTDLINWVRGADNFEDENSNTLTTDGLGDPIAPYDPRASIHGDVLHSRPAVVNYNRHGSGPDGIRGTADDVVNNDDVYIFYGSNDGIFRAVKGGFNQSAAGEPLPGQEKWGFIAEEFFPKMQRLRNNEPTISSSNKKDYFADGAIGVYVLDANDDNALDPSGSSGDKVYLFISMRRGGRFIYALDVTDPSTPKLLWRKSNADLPELGYTWSAPQVTTVNAQADPVLIFGAGYDPVVEDVTPSRITAVSSSSVTAGAAVYNRIMGRGIFVLDAFTGALLWQAGPAGSDTGLGSYHVVNGMDYAIPSDMAVITDRNGTIDNRAYVGDTGGNIWRIDMEDNNFNNWEVTRLASVADTGDIPAGLRKFQFPPDVVYSDEGFDAVLIGSGDREHPFDDTVVNRMYMFKDTAIGTSPVHGTDDSDGEAATLTEAGSAIPDPDLPAMFDATSNCIQDSTACGVGETPTSAAAELSTSTGWYITLGTGEKVVGNAVTLNNVTFFNTNEPTQGDPTSCESDLGVARQYKILFDDATALLDQNIDGYVTAADRSEAHPGGGYLPSPVAVVVEIDGQIHEGVISGVAVDTPPGSLLNARLRKFWFKEME